MNSFRLLMTSYLLHTVSSYNHPYREHANPTRTGVKWLEPERSVLVRLETPDLPLWNPVLFEGEDVPSALLFNFTFTRDNRVLLLNGEPILPIEDGNVPPVLSAPQTAASPADFEHDDAPEVSALSRFALDYWRGVGISEDPDSHYNIYNPTLDIDFLGAGISYYNTFLRNDKQRYIRVEVEERRPYQEYPYDKPISERTYMIKDVKLEDRYPYRQFSTPDQLQECHIWSWRCDGIPEYPWYQYVYRQHFDQYGRIGSLRHELYQRWGNLCDKLGFWRVVILMIVVASMAVSPFVFGIRHLVRMIRCRAQKIAYRRLADDADEDLPLYYERDEEVEGIMSQVVKDDEVVTEVVKGKPLPPLPA